MSYFVERDAGRAFPYVVYEGEASQPRYARRLIGCTQTLRGAKRVIRREQRGQLGLVYAVYDVADLPDLRKSELAPGG